MGWGFGNLQSGTGQITPEAIGAASLGEDGKVLPYQICSSMAVVNTSRALNLDDAGKFLQCASASPITLTVPTHADVAFPQGTEIEIAQLGAGAVTIVAAAGANLVSIGPTYSARTIAAQFGVVALKKYSTNYWIVSGALA